ncbi:MAG: putative addiction module antidote protein [Nitrospirales bacterium]|nr:putative addiction module antidote protein [Nitrospirales bacterium]
MTRKASRPFDFGNLDVLKGPKQAALYLEEILAGGDMDMFTEALKDVAAARVGNMTALAKKTHLAREALYTSLSRKGNPRLDTLTKVLDAAGLRLTVTTA